MGGGGVGQTRVKSNFQALLEKKLQRWVEWCRQKKGRDDMPFWAAVGTAVIGGDAERRQRDVCRLVGNQLIIDVSMANTPAATKNVLQLQNPLLNWWGKTSVNAILLWYCPPPTSSTILSNYESASCRFPHHHQPPKTKNLHSVTRPWAGAPPRRGGCR